ncbi:MAG: phosphoribosylglycinamide formyltransferase [Tindallia sp. MSAO_Bac2]|nr:MAG: phosphoribosylglycinamide formyltransferase [Tindallia sp. MSAO_Bac2]
MQPVRVAVLISGGGTNLQALMDAVDADKLKIDICLVISSRKDAYGIKRAENAGIPVKCLSEIHGQKKSEEEIMLEWLAEEKISLVVLAGFIRKIPEAVVKAYENRIINVHPSLIPAFAGAGYYGEKVHQAVYRRGVKLTGATVHFVNEGMDEGPIIMQEAVKLTGKESPEEISKKVLKIEHQILPKAVDLFVRRQLSVENGRVIIKEEVM